MVTVVFIMYVCMKHDKGTADSATHDLTLDLDLDGNTGNATITISGPSDVWFGVGFDAHTMADEPYVQPPFFIDLHICKAIKPEIIHTT